MKPAILQLSCALSVLCIGIAAPAGADIYRADIIGSTGTLVEPDKRDLIAFHGPVVKFKNEATGTLTLEYDAPLGLDRLMNEADLSLTLRYRDTGPADRVAVTLFQGNPVNGTNEVLLQFDSDSRDPSDSIQTVTVLADDADFFNRPVWLLVNLEKQEGGRPLFAGARFLVEDEDADGRSDFTPFVIGSVGKVDEADIDEVGYDDGYAFVQADSDERKVVTMRYDLGAYPQHSRFSSERHRLLVGYYDPGEDTQVIVEIKNTHSGETVIRFDSDDHTQGGSHNVALVTEEFGERIDILTRAYSAQVKLIAESEQAIAAIHSIGFHIADQGTRFTRNGAQLFFNPAAGQIDEADQEEVKFSFGNAKMRRSVQEGVSKIRFPIRLTNQQEVENLEDLAFEMRVRENRPEDAQVIVKLFRYNIFTGEKTLLARLDSADGADGPSGTATLRAEIPFEGIELSDLFFAEAKLIKRSRRGRPKIFHAFLRYSGPA